MKKSIVLFQTLFLLSLFFTTYSASAQKTYKKTYEACNCALEYAKLSDYCKGVCLERKRNSANTGDERIDVSEIIIHENITVGTGNPHGNENPWLMRVGSGKLPFMQIGKEGGIGLGTTLFPLKEGEVDLGSNRKPFRQISALKFAEISDRREKENIIDLTYGLKEVLELKPVSFTWKSKAIEGTQVGLIAQEVQELIPEIVISQEFTINDDGNQIALTTNRLSVAYSELVPVLINAIQEQQKIIEAQKQELGQQSSTIDNMETTVSQLIEALEAQGIQTQKAKTETGNSK
ncbi:MAG: tail fiber domain-containing protein [Chitinophagales bacterium]